VGRGSLGAAVAITVAAAACTTSSGTPAKTVTVTKTVTAGAGKPASSPSPGALPLDGGTYTWPNGVTMRLKVVKTGRWGVKDDYCGNGQCGVSYPDDLRWVLRYTISVPSTYRGTFDASNCPGDLHAVEGNDEDIINGVEGKYAKPLDSVLPGATKYGQNEYSILRAAVGKEFYIQSTCGTGDVFGGHPVLFRGVIRDKRGG
jgi:hypothetical protein